MLYIRTSARSYYRMDFAGSCDAQANEPLVIRPVDDTA